MIKTTVEHFLTQVCGGLLLTFLYVVIFIAIITAVTTFATIFYFSRRAAHKARYQPPQGFVKLHP